MPPRAPATPPPRIVLVIDDEADIRSLLTDFLSAEGYAVVSALDGREGLARLAAGLRPAVILFDLKMPVMNGWQFRAAQLADPALAAIPAIVTSGQQDAAQIAQDFPTVRHIRKPFRLAEVGEAVRALLAAAPEPPRPGPTGKSAGRKRAAPRPRRKK